MNKINDIASIIDRSPWFKNLPIEARQKLTAAAKIEDHPKNSFLFCMGDTSKHIYCLIAGRIRVSVTSSIGQELTLQDIEPEIWLGEAALYTDNGRAMQLQYKEAGQALSIHRNAVLEVGHKFPMMFSYMLKYQLFRTHSVYELLGGMVFYPLKARLAIRILNFLKTHGEEAEGGTYLNMKLSQQDFARLVFGSRQRINQIFRQWNEEGVMLMKSNRCFIPDIARLEQEAEKEEE